MPCPYPRSYGRGGGAFSLFRPDLRRTPPLSAHHAAELLRGFFISCRRCLAMWQRAMKKAGRLLRLCPVLTLTCRLFRPDHHHHRSRPPAWAWIPDLALVADIGGNTPGSSSPSSSGWAISRPRKRRW